MAKLRIRWMKSGIGHTRDQRATVRSLGLHRLGQSVTRDDTPVVRGMIQKVRHLLHVEPVADEGA